jgi:NAD+ synthase
VFALILPERELHGFYKDAADAKAFSKTLGIDYKIIDISPIIKTIQNACTPPGAYEPDRITIGNVKARARMVVLYYYANLMNRLVAGTGNKSELLTGYFTKYGDGGSDILPIGDLYKTQVKVLAERIGIPQEIIAKTPSAGLWVGQSDEAELGISYELLDKILHGLELSIAPEDISAKLNIDVSEVIRVRNMVTRGVHKRKFSRIPKLGIKTVGLDLREDHHKSL